MVHSHILTADSFTVVLRSSGTSWPAALWRGARRCLIRHDGRRACLVSGRRIDDKRWDRPTFKSEQRWGGDVHQGPLWGMGLRWMEILRRRRRARYDNRPQSGQAWQAAPVKAWPPITRSWLPS